MILRSKKTSSPPFFKKEGSGPTVPPLGGIKGELVSSGASRAALPATGKERIRKGQMVKQARDLQVAVRDL